MSKINIYVRNTTESDLGSVIKLCELVYPDAKPWTAEQLRSHLQVFPEGQLVAVDKDTEEVVGMAASLIILWNDYEFGASWLDFTDGGYFRNHDPEHGKTLYGAEVMVSPQRQGAGIGKLLYAGRRDIVKKFSLLRIRAGARLRGYADHARRMDAEEYVAKIITGKLGDPTLSFQIKQGFHVIGIVDRYLKVDPGASLGYAAVIEWLNEDLAEDKDYRAREKFRQKLLEQYPALFA